MIIDILDWIGSLFIIFGAIMITSKKESNPKIRIIALFLYYVSIIAWIPFSLMIRATGLFWSQIIFSFINLRGLYYCFKEIKKSRNLNE